MFFFTSKTFSLTFMPNTFAVPLLALICPVSILSRVVFPAPFGPNKPKNSPSFISSSTLFRARKSSYFYDNSLQSITVIRKLLEHSFYGFFNYSFILHVNFGFFFILSKYYFSQRKHCCIKSQSFFTY